jgi:general secretion pathway protein L
MAHVSPIKSGASQLMVASWQRFARWWLSGLKEVMPAVWSDWADGEAKPKVIVWREADAVICRLTSAAGAVEVRFSAVSFDAATLVTWLVLNCLSREEVTVGSVISRQLFFLRELTVPKAALDALPKILDQEVLRRTPFPLSDIWHGASVGAAGANDITEISHWIIRRDRAETALGQLGLKNCDVDFLAVADANGDAVPVINFRTADDGDPPWATRAVRLLAMAALLASIAGFTIFEWRQATVAAAIDASLADARQGAQSGRDGVEPVGRLIAMKADISILEVWEELSRILPDHTFLTEFRLVDGRVTLSGLSSDAARLVRIIDQSPLFAGPALAAAITPDNVESKERFSISFKVRGGRRTASAGRAPQ